MLPAFFCACGWPCLSKAAGLPVAGKQQPGWAAAVIGGAAVEAYSAATALVLDLKTV